ncbi:hypothetical protein Gotur_025528 [Gossypium turneri]
MVEAPLKVMFFSGVCGRIAAKGHVLSRRLCYPNEYVRDTTIAEARACVQALVFVEELGFRKIVVEGDTLTSSKSSNTWTGTGRQTIRFPDVLDRGGPARVEELADLDRGRLNEEERMGND